MLKLVLGTAQIGLNYGIANKTGKPDKVKAFELLKTALACGINYFDTSPVYGDSEKIIGDFIKGNVNRSVPPVMVTKLPKRCSNVDLRYYVKSQINESRSNLGIESIDYYLIHDPEDVYNKAILNCLFSCKEDGLIKEIGASVYTLEEADIAINNGLRVLQVPVNIFDQRFLDQQFIDRCKKNKVLLMARSVFLQGLFFYETKPLPAFLKPVRAYLETLQAICSIEGYTVHELALNFVCSIPEINHVIIGVDSLHQLKNNIEAVNNIGLPNTIQTKLKECFKGIPFNIIDPRNWKR